MFITIPKNIKTIAEILESRGFDCYIVGGAMRNMILKQKPKDWDLATDAEPEDIISIFKRVIPTGIAHGTVTILMKGQQYEITTFRCESDYSDRRRPDSVSFTRSLEEDLKRRDFTMNAIALHVKSEEIVDPHKGMEDIKNTLIRAIGDPFERLQEDGLRILRAFRFASQLDFSLEEETSKAISQSQFMLDSVSAERIRDEFEKILLSNNPVYGFELMDTHESLLKLFPELTACKGVTQKGDHNFDVYYHCLYTCEGAPKDLVIRLAGLFHDIGKPVVRGVKENGEVTFYNHQQKSSEIAQNILQRLKFPNSLIKKTCHLISHHMFDYTEEFSDAAVRRFIARVGIEYIEPLFQLRYADQYGFARKKPRFDNLKAFRKHIQRVLDEEAPFSIKDLAVNGNTLHTQAGIPKGPQMGTVLYFLLDTVLDDPSQNTEEQLIHIARKFYETRLKTQESD
ncbi:MAG: CCA tRNA nucleotidyltransferase [Spirochaetia bacterium]